jgi:hypothetical protein
MRAHKPVLYCQKCGLTRITGAGPCDECGGDDFRAATDPTSREAIAAAQIAAGRLSDDRIDEIAEAVLATDRRTRGGERARMFARLIERECGRHAPLTDEFERLRDEIAGVLRYCRDVQESGTPNERVVALAVARMLARAPGHA